MFLPPDARAGAIFPPVGHANVPCAQRTDAKSHEAMKFLLIILAGSSIAFCALPDTSSPRLSLFCDYRFDIDAGWFLFQKDSFFVHRRYAQSISHLELTLASYGPWHSVWWIQTRIGMGQTPGNVVFDVVDLNYSLCPTIEYRFSQAILQAGIDHRCFHEVDRSLLRVAYWNKVFLIAGSPHMRIGDFLHAAVRDTSWSWRTRLSWQAQWGFFLKEFFGLVHPGKLNGMNQRVHELVIKARFAAWKRGPLMIALHARSLAGGQERGAAPAVYWQQQTGLELHYTRGLGAMLYIDYYRDSMPLQENKARFSMDRLLEIGIRVFD